MKAHDTLHCIVYVSPHLPLTRRFGGRLDDYPHPEADFAAFKQYIAELNNASPFVLGTYSVALFIPVTCLRIRSEHR